MPKIRPFLWFDNNAEQAVEFYISVFPNSRRTHELLTTEAGPGPKGSILTIEFELDGEPFIALNGGPGADHQFNDSVSFTFRARTRRRSTATGRSCWKAVEAQSRVAG